ncbi:MAG: type II toxin-antitoxin system mRNA interferase toxin, RelE/StbE family [Candidatus Aminicenantes bacterium]|nr:type II toxin-antitoxin system mRNA interferase toxin, RelE/StbE family [Candidatus Aminicenantes bacterium]
MITLEYTKTFLKEAKHLPKTLKPKLAEQLSRLSENPFDARLHTKPLKGKLVGFYSFRITREYRVIFELLNPKYD